MSRSRRQTRGRRACSIGALALACTMVACSESGSDSSASDSTGVETPTSEAAVPVSEQAAGSEAPATVATEPADVSTSDTEAAPAATEPPAADDGLDFSVLGPPAGAPIRVGLVNTEGAPGLDFPEIRINITAATDYLNQHGGMGDRPIDLVTCTANGSPEGSQACAQEIVGKDVELVMLGLDVFPDYATYTAAGVPVVGVLPILPGDYSSNALFLTGGNATLMAAIASVASTHFEAQRVAIIAADSPGSNSSTASLTASLDLAGVAHTTVKGGDNETDAGFQGLMREATKDDPDLIVSLYSDAGCIGTMRARASLGITAPVITTGICASDSVLDEVGDDAIGWTFSGVSSRRDSPAGSVLRTIMAPVLDVAPEEVDPSSLGLGALGLFLVMSLAQYADQITADGGEVTGSAMYELLGSGSDLTLWGTGSPVTCGASPKYPTICSFVFPFAEYVAGGDVQTVAGLERVDSLELLP